MQKQSIARVLSLVFAFYLLISLPVGFTRADDYKKEDDDEDAVYYIVEGESVKKLFDFSIYDIKDILVWALEFQTFTVIKESEEDDGSTSYKMYFNTPNLQMLAKNQITSGVNDGYTDSTYDPNETEWIVPVGKNATSENVITKYGFSVPSYTYWGEYPQETMATAGILPSNWWDGVVRFFKTLLGFSYIEPPDADNFKTIKYQNHGYKDESEFLINFFKEYYIKFFVEKIAVTGNIEGYFANPQDVLKKTVTKEANDQAEEFTDTHETEYLLTKKKLDGYNKFAEDSNSCDIYAGAWTKDALTKKVNAFYPGYDNGEETDYNNRINAYMGGDTNAILWMARNLRYAPALLAYFKDTPDETLYWERFAYAYACVYAELETVGHGDGLDKDTLKSAFGMTNGTFEQDKGTFRDAVLNILNRCDDDSVSTYLKFFINAVFVSQDQLITYGGLYVHGDQRILNEINDSDTRVDRTTSNQHICYYYISDPDHTKVVANFKGTTVEDFYNSNLYVFLFDWQADDWLNEADRGLIATYDEMMQVQRDYDLFCDIMGKNVGYKDPNEPIPCIAYNQCLIPNEGDSGECKNDDYGTDVSLCIADVYVYSGLWEITKDYINFTGDTNPNPAIFEDRDTLTDEAVAKVLNTIKNYTGPYYSDVIVNIIKLMVNTAAYDKVETLKEDIYEDDPRVMPYDIDTLTNADRDNYECSDPRVDRYKKHVVGMAVALEISIPDIGMYITPQKAILSITGKITELSVFMQQLISFDYFDAQGLSPTTMWGEGFIDVVMEVLVLVFIVVSCWKFIKMQERSLAATFGAFLILVVELGFFGLLLVKKDDVWRVMKNVENRLIYLGEMSTVYGDDNLRYLYGDAADMEVTYYMPYLDAWSKYNTGYGIRDEEHQLMNLETDKAELIEMEDADYPHIGSEKVKHYSVMLMDSFSYYGDCRSPLTSIAVPITKEDGTTDFRTVNGTKINNNAYRVVDHFLAPRVSVQKKDGDKLSLKVTQNENYNGEFQSGMIDLIVKLMNAVLMCLLSLIKLLTFLWQWFLLYLLVFKIAFAKTAEHKSWKQIILQLFAPTLGMVVIGFFAGMALIIGMTAEGFFGIFVEIALFVFVFTGIRWWKNYRNGEYFPKTLLPVYYVTNMRDARRHRQTEKMKIHTEQMRRDAGLSTEDMTLDQTTEQFFNEDGTLKGEYMGANEQVQRVIDDWYDRAYRTETGQDGSGRAIQLSDKTKRAKEYFESMNAEKTRKIREKVDAERQKTRNHNKSGYNKIKSKKKHEGVTNQNDKNKGNTQ